MTQIYRLTARIAVCTVIASSFISATLAADKDPGKPNPVVTAVARAMGKLRADDDMLAVLNAHASLNPKAVEKIDPATARMNPTIADAVKVVLQQQGRSTKPEDLVSGVTSRDTTAPLVDGDPPSDFPLTVDPLELVHVPKPADAVLFTITVYGVAPVVTQRVGLTERPVAV